MSHQFLLKKSVFYEILLYGIQCLVAITPRFPDDLINCQYIMAEVTHKLYSLQLSNINCTNCQNKIKTALRDRVSQGLLKVTVIILQQKVNVVIQNQQVLQKVISILNQIGYRLIGDPMFLQTSNENIRNATFVYEANSMTDPLEKIIRQTAGVSNVQRSHIKHDIKIRVEYDTRIVKGREIADIIREKDPKYVTINQRVESFKKMGKTKQQKKSINSAILLLTYFVIFHMILPFTGQWFQIFVSFPKVLGPFSFTVLLNFIITLYALNLYAKPILLRSFRNYFQNGNMDMETLISLGSASAFLLFIMLILKYTYEYMASSLSDTSTIQLNNSLASSAMIVLVVTIGKHFQSQVKNKIQQISQKIFPESTLFSSMNVNWIRLKNRKLKVDAKQEYDVSLLEVDDIFQIKNGRRLLVDAIVLAGEYEAIKCAVDGNDKVRVFQKGSKLDSGSIIVSSSQNAMLQVENVFEKSILVEIGTHIKLRSNQEENTKSGIQAVCQTVSIYFVKTIILASLIVTVVWAYLLFFNYVEIEGCQFCWVAERGIGVLVASCPCALGLAIPSVVAIVLKIAIKNGILIKNNSVFDKMKKCKIISFDKTGTLFTRINRIEQHHLFNEKVPANILWQIIAIIEKPIKHPIAEILYKEAFKFSNVQGTNFSVFISHKPSILKSGIKAQVTLKKTNQQIDILLGNKHILEQHGISVPSYKKTSPGATELFLTLNNEVHLVLVINTHSNLRPEALEVIELLMKNKKEVHVLSGDSRASVQKLGKKLKIPGENLHPQHTAHMKMAWIKKIQQGLEKDNGIGVIMVGDGLNDIPCLQEASIGISINGKSELNINASDVIMLSEDLFKILSFVKLLEKGNTFININLFWAFIYNIIMMPIVAGAFYSFNLTISPIWSSVAMSCSSIFVVAFSHLLTIYQYDQHKKNEMKARETELQTYRDSSINDYYEKFSQDEIIKK